MKEQVIKIIKTVLETHTCTYNDPTTRQEIVTSLTNSLEIDLAEGTTIVVKCDEENNPPSIIDSNSLCVSVVVNDKLFVQVTTSPHPFQIFSFVYDVVVRER